MQLEAAQQELRATKLRLNQALKAKDSFRSKVQDLQRWSIKMSGSLTEVVQELDNDQA